MYKPRIWLACLVTAARLAPALRNPGFKQIYLLFQYALKRKKKKKLEKQNKKKKHKLLFYCGFLVGEGRFGWGEGVICSHSHKSF